MADVVIDGERLGATRIRMRTPYAAETRYEKKFEEAMVRKRPFQAVLTANRQSF